MARTKRTDGELVVEFFMTSPIDVAKSMMLTAKAILATRDPVQRVQRVQGVQRVQQRKGEKKEAGSAS
ncbi:MAG: hypothetical protein ACRD22_15430 [Terriglobia bacterium]